MLLSLSHVLLGQNDVKLFFYIMCKIVLLQKVLYISFR